LEPGNHGHFLGGAGKKGALKANRFFERRPHHQTYRFVPDRAPLPDRECASLAVVGWMAVFTAFLVLAAIADVVR
jgi:hypothetical protein